MADYVVDTSIIAQRFVRDTHTEQTQRLFTRLTTPDNFHMPEFCLVECTNVFWKRVRFDSLPQSEAEILLKNLNSYPFTIHPLDSELLTRALQIGLQCKLAVYDCVYIALAEKYAYPLITADAKQETAARTVGVTIKPITEF